MGKVKVDGYKRSKPSTPAYQGDGNKPGPKPVIVEGHVRSLPKKIRLVPNFFILSLTGH